MDRPQQPRGGHRAAADANLRAPHARRWPTAPNLLSLARLPMGALFWQVVDDVPAHLIGPFLALAAAAVTDVLDGYLAPRRGVTSGVGAWLDPICDQVFLGAVLAAHA